MKSFLRYVLGIIDRFPLCIHLHRFIKSNALKNIIGVLLFFIAFPYYLILRLSTKKYENKEFKYQLAIALIVKNEAPYIKEWINYHRLIGFEKFIIYDNESTDGLEQVLKEYINSGLVEYKIVKGKQRQNDVYNITLQKYYKTIRYIAFIDADEFVFVNSGNTLDAVCNIFGKDKRIGGIAINWLIYGSSGHIEKPDGLVVENYLYRAEDDFIFNRHIKSIVNPRKVLAFRNPHCPVYFRKYKAVNSLGVTVNGSMSDDVDLSVMHINHYFTKSKEEFEAKRRRGMADNLSIRDKEDFELHDKNELFDDSILRYIKELKAD